MNQLENQIRLNTLYIKPRRRWRRSLWTVLVLLIVLVLATCGVAYYTALQLTHAKRDVVKGTPADHGLTYENISFPSSEDHVTIRGWLVPADQPTDKIIIMSHGFRNNRIDYKPAWPTLQALHNAGFTVLTFDYRAEGASDGNLISVGYYEQRDLRGAVDYAESKGYTHVGVYGVSMGASTALYEAGTDPRVEALLADSPFANLHDYLWTNMPVWSHLPNFPFTVEMLTEIRWFEGLDASKVDPLSAVKHWQPRPLLLIAGTADTDIPMSNSQTLYDAVKSNPADSLWIVPGAKHVGAYTVQPQAYLDKVVTFFKNGVQ